MAPPAAEPCAEDRHQGDHVSGELLLKASGGLVFKDPDRGACPAAEKPDELRCEPQEPVLVDNGQGMDLLLQDQSDQGPEAGFPAVEAGSDVRDHLFAAAFPQPFHLADEIPFLVMGRDPCVSDVTPSHP